MTKNCSSREEGHFLAIKPESGVSETGKGETANRMINKYQDVKASFFGHELYGSFLRKKRTKKRPGSVNAHTIGVDCPGRLSL